MDTDKELKTLIKLPTEAEAHLLRAELNQHGIPAMVAGDSGAGFVGLDSPGLKPIHVHVRKIDFERAKEVMDAFYAHAPREKVAAWKCKCGADVDEGFYTCWSCGAEYEDLLDDLSD